MMGEDRGLVEEGRKDGKDGIFILLLSAFVMYFCMGHMSLMFSVFPSYHIIPLPGKSYSSSHQIHRQPCQFAHCLILHSIKSPSFQPSSQPSGTWLFGNECPCQPCTCLPRHVTYCSGFFQQFLREVLCYAGFSHVDLSPFRKSLAQAIMTAKRGGKEEQTIE